MLDKKIADTIAYAIRKKCSNYDLTEWCEIWGFSVDDFDEFLECAFKYIDLQE